MSILSFECEHLEKSLDLNEKCIKKPDSTFFIKAPDDSMKEAGITEDDHLVVDHSLTPFSRSLVVVHLEGEIMVRRLIRKKGLMMLYPENEEHFPIRITPEMDFEIMGVVTFIVHNARV